MSFIQFESATEKEKARQELREERAHLLKQAELKSKKRDEHFAQKNLRGDDKWMLPSVSKRIDEDDVWVTDRNDLHKKTKKSKKQKKQKKSKKRKHHSRDSDESSSDELLMQKKKKKKHKKNKSSSNNSDDSETEWIEKTNIQSKDNSQSLVRDDWMSGMLIPTFSKPEQQPKRADNIINSYDPSKSNRELNPYWRDGGIGLPPFKKPLEYETNSTQMELNKSNLKGNWRKTNNSTANDAKMLENERKYQAHNTTRKKSKSPDGLYSRSPTPPKHKLKSKKKHSSSSSDSSDENKITSKAITEKSYENAVLTDQQMNELGAKLIKAEILGNTTLATELQKKLENARNNRNSHKINLLNKSHIHKQSKQSDEEHILLTTTNSKGISRPLQQHHRPPPPTSDDRWGGRRKGKKVETHVSGDRVRYFADDDKYDIKQMFEREKFITAAEQDEQFINIAGKHKTSNDDLEDIFTDKIRTNITNTDKKEVQRAMHQNEEFTRTLNKCDLCQIKPEFIIAIGKNVYLLLPSYEGLTPGHCLIVPIQHISCSTLLDEDVWNEVQEFRQALSEMFTSLDLHVIFFETVSYLNKRPHMTIHCVASNKFEVAPFFFLKAIQESEAEWSTNKQVIDLRNSNVRRAVPRGLPYFWVHFGMTFGYAHIIEEQITFSTNFAQKIICGILELDASCWRKPRKEKNIVQKVKQFFDWWRPFDITINN